MTFRIDWDEDAREELMGLPVAERRAVMTAVAKLEIFGDRLGALALAGAPPAAG